MNCIFYCYGVIRVYHVDVCTQKIRAPADPNLLKGAIHLAAGGFGG